MERNTVISRAALLGSMLLALAAGQSWAGEFKAYPGATVDAKASEAATAAASAAGLAQRSTIYTSPDDFEKVASFYAAIGTVIPLPASMAAGTKLSDGRVTHIAWISLDGSTSLATSKRWIAVQHPYVGMLDGAGKAQDVRDVTAITLTEAK